ncbi:MAG: hypothetical protein K6F00_06660 [Lachnospiraceae bacterium]|nr:hypothetical protein [Lachnospiraceae bacterium]
MERTLSISAPPTPSRKECEKQIRRILMTEVLQQGKNIHFKTAKDFMSYFESLYSPSGALTKQVQRAIKSMDMPKDERGYFIIDKTKSQLADDKELSYLMDKSNAVKVDIEGAELLFVALDTKYMDYVISLIEESKTLSGKFITVIPSANGLVFITKNKPGLSALLDHIMGLTKSEEDEK